MPRMPLQPMAVAVIASTRPTHAPVPRVHAADTQTALVCKAQAVWLGDSDEECYCGGDIVTTTVAYPVEAKGEAFRGGGGPFRDGGGRLGRPPGRKTAPTRKHFATPEEVFDAFHKVVPLLSEWPASDGATPTPQRSPCRCKTSRCLKLYCSCFAAGQLCSAGVCRCDACFNDGLLVFSFLSPAW